MKQKCFQITTKRVRRSQQFQLRRQPVPCSRCSNREGSVANSSTCPRHDEVATRWSAQCRSTGNISDRCQKVWDMFRRSCVPEATCEPVQQAQLVLDPLSDCNQCNSRRAGVTWSRGLRSRTVRAAACRTRRNGASVEAGRSNCYSKSAYGLRCPETASESSVSQHVL